MEKWKEKQRKMELDLIFNIIKNNYENGVLDKLDILILSNDILKIINEREKIILWQ